jgi:hypothetical protein
MHVSFSLFADAANISQEGKLNILGVFDAVHVGQIPALHPRATFVIRIKATPADAGTHTLTLRWVNPRGAELWGSEAQLDVGTPPSGTTELDMPVILQLDLPLDMIGDYRMVIKLAEGQESTSILHVKGSGTPTAVVPGAGMIS